MVDHEKLLREVAAWSAPPRLPELRTPSAFETQLAANRTALRPLIHEQAENLTAVMHARITQLQSSLNPDEELVVTSGSGPDGFRVHSFEFPEWNVVILSGVDAQNNKTQRIAHVQTIQITCKVVKTVAGNKVTIGFIWPEKK